MSKATQSQTSDQSLSIWVSLLHLFFNQVRYMKSKQLCSTFTLVRSETKYNNPKKQSIDDIYWWSWHYVWYWWHLDIHRGAAYTHTWNDMKFLATVNLIANPETHIQTIISWSDGQGLTQHIQTLSDKAGTL